jgi:endonuclease YncB( thermonuclease family)
MALLRVTGSISLDQFWPTGSSDADTSKVIVKVGPNAFQYRLPGQAFRTTHAFDNARIGRKPVITEKKRELTIRLQGIDAPELHYEAAPLPAGSGVTLDQRKRYNELNEKFRQKLAETATVALGKFLGGAGASSVPCTVETAVDEPGEALDKYGRFVGDIFVRVGNKKQNVNLWLLAQGWAYPGIYNSMTNDEIRAVSAAAAKGRQKKSRVWSPNMRSKVGRLDWKLLYRPPKSKPVVDQAADKGAVILPKLFRRLVEWEVKKRANLTSLNYRPFVADKSSDKCFRTAEFLKERHAAVEHHIVDFLTNDSTFQLRPEEVVFKESSSTMKDPSGKEITKW